MGITDMMMKNMIKPVPQGCMTTIPGVKMIRSFDPGEDIIAMTEHNGVIIVATRRPVYEYIPELQTWDQMVFRHIDPDDFQAACDAYGKAAGNDQ